jgi:predicted nuclease with RNAse H fold
MKVFIGIDIAEERGCALAAIDEAGRSCGSHWSRCDASEIARAVQRLAGRGADLTIGIDAPRTSSKAARHWYWERKRSAWRPRRPAEPGWGRHCEVVVAAMRLANPQWTPPTDAAPGWMQFGFSVFEALSALGDVLEVFPSASYTQLVGSDEPRLELSFRGFAQGPKDMLDAYLSAITALEYRKGNGVSVGGGDGLGEIVLPRPLVEAPAELLTWPAQHVG